jgi:hypothetical protein
MHRLRPHRADLWLLLGVLLTLPRVGAAARPVLFTGEPVVVRLQYRQPTAVQFPEPIVGIPTGADPETLSLEAEGPRLFLQPRTRDVQGRLFVLGVSGRSYPVHFVVGRPADTDVVVTLLQGPPRPGIPPARRRPGSPAL